MEWLLLVLIAGGGGFAAKRWRNRTASRRSEQVELDGVRRLADEDVTVLGEQLQRLDGEVEGHDLDAATRLDYQTALDAYETAQRSVAGIRGADESARSPTLCPPAATRLPVFRLALAAALCRNLGCPALQSPARAVVDHRAVDPTRSWHAYRPRVRARRRTGGQPRGSGGSQGQDRFADRSVLGSGRRVSALRRGLLRWRGSDSVNSPATHEHDPASTRLG